MPLLLLALPLCLIASSYSTLPATIPTHFDIRGEADDWGGKGMLLLLPAVSLSLYVLMTAVNAGITLAEDPRSLINLGEERRKAIPRARAEQLRVFLGRSLLAFKTITAGLMAYCVHATIEVARGEAAGLGPWFYVILGSLLLCTAIIVWRALSLALARDS